MDWYSLVVFIHAAAILLFFIAHGTSMAVAFAVKREEDPQRLRARLDRESPFVTDGTIRSAPMVAGDTVYVGSDDRKLYAVDIPTGRQRWSWKTGNWVRSSPVVVDGLVIVASGDGTVTAIGEKPTAAP